MMPKGDARCKVGRKGKGSGCVHTAHMIRAAAALGTMNV
jgi:hypothetical protein